MGPYLRPFLCRKNIFCYASDCCLPLNIIRETLPTTVMEASVHLNETCLRSLTAKHHGYESATEGDSFIIAFHNVESAVRFCLEAQESLLDLPWPEALLQTPGCKEVWVAPRMAPPPDSSSPLKPTGTMIRTIPSPAALIPLPSSSFEASAAAADEDSEPAGGNTEALEASKEAAGRSLVRVATANRIATWLTAAAADASDAYPRTLLAGLKRMWVPSTLPGGEAMVGTRPSYPTSPALSKHQASGVFARWSSTGTAAAAAADPAAIAKSPLGAGAVGRSQTCVIRGRLALRGLCIRMGMHCGAPASCIRWGSNAGPPVPSGCF